MKNALFLCTTLSGTWRSWDRRERNVQPFAEPSSLPPESTTVCRAEILSLTVLLTAHATRTSAFAPSSTELGYFSLG
jgi:hypothetical protein